MLVSFIFRSFFWFNMEDMCQLDERAQLKEERKRRKKEKKKSRQLERKKQLEAENLLFQLRPQGHNVTIITSEFVEQKLRKPMPVRSILSSDDFPTLPGGSGTSYRIANHQNAVEATQIPQPPRAVRRSADTMKLRMDELINREPQQDKKPKPIDCKPSTSSNPLDSSKPERKVGKHREFPKEKRKNKLKQEILNDRERLASGEVPENSKFIYYDNIVSDTLNMAVKELIKNVVELQEKLYNRNPEKGKRKKRYVVGLHEIKKFLLVKKVKILIFASDMQVVENGTLHMKIKELISIATDKEIPHAFALKRNLIGRLTLKQTAVSCIGIINYEGADEYFHKVMKELGVAKQDFAAIQNFDSKEQDKEDVTTQLLTNLMDALKND